MIIQKLLEALKNKYDTFWRLSLYYDGSGQINLADDDMFEFSTLSELEEYSNAKKETVKVEKPKRGRPKKKK